MMNRKLRKPHGEPQKPKPLTFQHFLTAIGLIGSVTIIGCASTAIYQLVTEANPAIAESATSTVLAETIPETTLENTAIPDFTLKTTKINEITKLPNLAKTPEKEQIISSITDVITPSASDTSSTPKTEEPTSVPENTPEPKNTPLPEPTAGPEVEPKVEPKPTFLEAIIRKKYLKEITKPDEKLVLIDISKQHLWVLENQELVMETDVVTGLANGRRDTPTGIYAIYWCKKGKYLTGPTWRCWVDYWMPFNGSIGLHDASWRSSFGGDIYTSNGSHGCVNLPHDFAAELFDFVQVGTTVIVQE